jgi:hypothetical protein
MTPHADRLEVNPVLPEDWGWVAMSRMPYRGLSLSLVAVKKGKTIYTTVRVKTKWKQVLVPADEVEDRIQAQKNQKKS